jgi:putative transposase
MQNGYWNVLIVFIGKRSLMFICFFALDQAAAAAVRQLTAEWIYEYNHRRPHEDLQNMTSIERKSMLMKKEETKKMAV